MTISYTFRSNGETGTVNAQQPVPGLFIYQLPEHLRHPFFPWRLGHSSGLCIAVFQTEQEALEGAREIADFADWTLTADQLRAQVDAYELCRRIEGFTGGVFISAEPTGDVQDA